MDRRATFSATGYAAARPSYPASLFKTVLAYHNDGPRSFLLDLGCGHGLVAREMSPRFDRVMGVDMSAGMIKQASSMTDDAKVVFHQGGAEDLSIVSDGAVDMVVAGQSAHWFDFARAWPELARVVRPGGTLAFWGYKDNILVGYPRANQVLDRFCYADGEVAPGVLGMKRFWEQPGRERLRNLLRDVEPPMDEWRDVERILYDVQGGVADAPDAKRAWMRKRITLGELEAYLRTFSAFQGWLDAHPQARSRAEGGDGPGDLVDMAMDRIVASEAEWKAMGERWRNAEVETVWGTHILLAQRQ